MSVEKERKAFEKWVLTYPDNLDLTTYEENIMFDAWLQSANREGYKLVPVVDTDAMWSAGRAVIEDDGYSADASDVYKAMIGACDDH